MKDLKREFRITFEDKYKNGVLHCFDNYEDAEKKFVEVCHKFIDDRKEYIKVTLESSKKVVEDGIWYDEFDYVVYRHCLIYDGKEVI